MLDTFKKATPEALAAIREEMEVRRTSEVFLLFSMGSQFDHLIFQKLAKLGVYCLVADPASVTVEDVRALMPIGIVVSGGPASVSTEPPPFDTRIFDLDIPVLGICLGFQMWAKHLGCEVSAGHSQFSQHDIALTEAGRESPLFVGCPPRMKALQSHGDAVERGVLSVSILAYCDDIIAAASVQHLYGVQFHPEVTETTFGEQILGSFCFVACKAKDQFPAEDIAQKKIAELKERIGDKKVLLAISGGSDSSTGAYLLKEAVADKTRLRGVYIRGIDRPDDEAFVHEYFGNEDWIELVVVDATDRFLEVLAGKTTMKEKRIAMRGVYKLVLEEAAAAFGADFIAQGTLYTDICESGGGHQSGARKAQIKQHHNTNLGFSLPELTPLDDCVKDGGRDIGRSIGVPEVLLIRHPFPGPGLVVRIEGEVTREKLAMARHLDGIYIEELRGAGLYESIWQAGAVVTKSEQTFTKGDDAGMGAVIAYWAVWSVNGFTAKAAELPFELHRRIARRFANEVPGVAATVYRTSDKPPSTIEWG